MDPQLQELLNLIRHSNKDKVQLVTKAFYFAKKAHEGQTRYSGEPYFNHVVETAKNLAELGMGKSTISAGLLHDVLEDADVSEEELEREFGKKIVFLVQGVTKLGTIRYTGEDRHTESLRKFFVAMSRDIRVLIIKLADRLHNMQTLDHIPEEKRYRIALETMEIYVPLAYRLGMRKLKRELEDLSFKYIQPEDYNEIQTALKKKRVSDEERLEKVRKILLKEIAKEGIKNVATDMRQKSIFSVYCKLKHKGRDLDKIYDLSALRVNVDTVSDCYRVLGVIHGLWRPLPGRIKDYIAFPKPNAYQSLHTTVFTGDGAILEVQIRTHAMHDHAEYGVASHMVYKLEGINEDPNFSWFRQFFPGPGKQNIKNKVDIDEERVKHIPEWIKQLVDVQSYVSTTNEFIDNLKTDFFQHRMFIFNTHGNVIDLPIQSSVIDYAYAEDSNNGNFLFNAKVNGKPVPLETTLKNGDIVEIQTRPSSKPYPKWIENCKTSFAKRQIRLALEKEKTNSPKLQSF